MNEEQSGAAPPGIADCLSSALSSTSSATDVHDKSSHSRHLQLGWIFSHYGLSRNRTVGTWKAAVCCRLRRCLALLGGVEDLDIAVAVGQVQLAAPASDLARQRVGRQHARSRYGEVADDLTE